MNRYLNTAKKVDSLISVLNEIYKIMDELGIYQENKKEQVLKILNFKKQLCEYCYVELSELLHDLEVANETAI